MRSFSLLFLFIMGCRSPSLPAITIPLIAGLAGKAISLHGRGFSTPGPAQSLVLQSSGAVLELPSTDPSVGLWRDEQITFTLAADALSGTVVVKTGAGRSAPVSMELFRYDAFAIPPTPNINAVPLALALDGRGRAWVNQEFHYDFQMLELATGRVTALHPPRPPDPGVFADDKVGPDARRQFSDLGEDVLVDSRGRVWFTQGGGLTYNGPFPNHSRIVCYDPAGASFRVYNVPDDNAQVIGLAWDEARNRIWFVQGGPGKRGSPGAGGKLYSFNPDTFPWRPADNTFDFSTPVDASAYQIYPLPHPDWYPAHLAVDSAGLVWYTYYWGNAVGRMDPSATPPRFVELPLPWPVSAGSPNNHSVFSSSSGGGWRIREAPDRAIVFNEQFDNQLNRIEPARLADLSSCTSLDSRGQNPCIRDLLVPQADLNSESVSDFAFDATGRIWYTQAGSPTDMDGPASLGLVAADWSYAVRLPPLPRAIGDSAPLSTGVSIDAATGDIWFNEYLRHQVSRLKPLGSLVGRTR